MIHMQAITEFILDLDTKVKAAAEQDLAERLATLLAEKEACNRRTAELKVWQSYLQYSLGIWPTLLH